MECRPRPNKFRFGDECYLPVFNDAGSLRCILKAGVDFEFDAIRRVGIGINHSMHVFKYDLTHWGTVSEYELFPTLEEAEEYARQQMKAHIDNIENSLKRLGKD